MMHKEEKHSRFSVNSTESNPIISRKHSLDKYIRLMLNHTSRMPCSDVC